MAPPVGPTERAAMAERVAALPRREAPADPAGASAPEGPWLPTCAAPRSLYAVYRGTGDDRLTDAVVASGRNDLDALGIDPSLDQRAFAVAVAQALNRMPAIRVFLEAAGRDLSEDEAVRLIDDLGPDGALFPEVRWRVLTDWLTYFFQGEIELAPAKYILRRTAASSRR